MMWHKEYDPREKFMVATRLVVSRYHEAGMSCLRLSGGVWKKATPSKTSKQSSANRLLGPVVGNKNPWDGIQR
jgi:hypothetical protein